MNILISISPVHPYVMNQLNDDPLFHFDQKVVHEILIIVLMNYDVDDDEVLVQLIMVGMVKELLGYFFTIFFLLIVD